MTGSPGLHESVALRLAAQDQRYTRLRRRLVETLAGAGRPLSVPEILADAPGLPQSSAYRVITDLAGAGVVRRVSAGDDFGRFELAEPMAEHHHHMVCAGCGRVDDVAPNAALELALREATSALSRQHGYDDVEHRLDMVGRCPDCRNG